MDTPYILECDLCGCKKFYKEEGFFYCTECQTQSQNFREQEFETDAHFNASTVKKVGSKEDKTKDSTLTSWECYNFILYGLVNELLELGADKKLRKTVKIIWLRYLKKLGVVSETANHLPELAAVNSKKDARIIYGVSLKQKRKRKHSSSNSCSSTSTGSNVKNELGKRKKALIKLEHETVTSEVTKSSHSEQLSNFQDSTNNKSGASANTPVKYNMFANRELTKLMCYDHLMEHRKDKSRMLHCHKIACKDLKKYACSAMIITRKRIFAILYLGLLIIKDRIQLSDMLRYINEGHLSYNEYLHLFPENLGTKKLNIYSYNKKVDNLTHTGVRKMAWQIVELLNLQAFIPIPNIIELSERYCLELNLPEEIHQYVVSIIGHTLPFLRHPIDLFHNYEGRTISYIMLILKLLFGLDDKTEYALSKFANIVNERSTDEKKMLNFIDWLTFIEYRKIVLCENYFPNHSKDDEDFIKTDLFVNFMQNFNSKYDIVCTSSDTKYAILKDLLVKQSNFEKYETNFGNVKSNLPSFSHSLTPFHTYLSTLMKTDYQTLLKYNKSILTSDFRNVSLDFLINQDKYLTLNPDLEIRHGGANENLQFLKVFTSTRDKNLCSKKNVHVTNEQITNVDDVQETPIRLTKKRMDEHIYKHQHSVRYHKTKYLNKTEKRIKQDFYNTYKIHYQPYESYLLRIPNTHLQEDEFKVIFDEFSLSFQLILRECSRITEQTLYELYQEFSFVEQHLCYKYDKSNPILDKRLEEFINDRMKYY